MSTFAFGQARVEHPIMGSIRQGVSVELRSKHSVYHLIPEGRKLKIFRAQGTKAIGKICEATEWEVVYPNDLPHFQVTAGGYFQAWIVKWSENTELADRWGDD